MYSWALTLLLLCCTGMSLAQDFKSKQLRYPRVREAYEAKAELINALLTQKGLDPADFKLYLRAFKQERELELWAKSPNQEGYVLLKTYPFCSSSGELGPKRQQGDGQIPEGYYHVDRYNPASNFHLSLGVNYPNASDKKRARASDPGGDIFIHGACVTIGCIPITDELIKEVYLLALEARHSGNSHIPVSFFPARMEGSSWEALKRSKEAEPQLLAFWQELEPGYRYFQKHHLLPTVHISSSGAYQLGQ